MYKIVISLILSLVIYTNLSGQEKGGPKEWFVEAESYFLFQEYKDALPLYQQLIRVDPDNYNVLYKIGICYLNDPYQKEKAIVYLSKAAEHITLNYKQNTIKEKLAPPEARYYLGKAYHVNGNFKEAIEQYQNFLSGADPVQFDLDLVKEDIEACQRAMKVYNNPIYCKFDNLSKTVNSRFEDFNPVLSGDGKVLAFTRRMQFYDGVFVAVKKSDGTWSEPYNVTGDFGLDGSSLTTGISYFGDEIFVYRSDNYDGNIYSSKRINNKWNKLEKLNENINTKFWESHASPSFDGQYLIFTSNRDGGYGGLDIYKSKRNSNGDWGSAVNMGPVLNSPLNEETPFLSNEGYSIFFSSEGHNTIGGYDIYVSRQNSDGTWSKPYNMGYPVNTADDNLFYFPSGVDNFGLYSVFDNSTSNGLSDIYRIEVYNTMIPRNFRVTGRYNVENEDDKILKKLSVRLIDLKTQQTISESLASDKGQFEVSASQGEYQLVIEGPGVETFRKSIELKVSQPDNLVMLPEISLARADNNLTPDPSLVQQPVTATIQVKKDYYSVSDSSAVPIELLLDKRSDLEIVVSVDNKVINKENIADVRKHFTYFYKPRAGENILRFTAVNQDRQVFSKEVVVVYTPRPPEKPAPLLVREVTRPEASSSLNILSAGNLKQYLDELDMNQYDNYYELYLHLAEISDEKGFSVEDVNNLFSLYFTQKDAGSFYRGFDASITDIDSMLVKLRDSIDTPIVYLKSVLGSGYLDQNEFQNILLLMSEKRYDKGSAFYLALTEFLPDSLKPGKPDSNLEDLNAAFNKLNEFTGNSPALDALMLFSTTDDLNLFYQNLLINAGGDLHNYMNMLKFEEEDIHSAPDLVLHLFANSSNAGYNTEDLFKALELAQQNRRYYIDMFIEMLASGGKGDLKSHLLHISKNSEMFDGFEEIITYMVNQSKFNNYSPENVYKLLIDLIGIDDVNKFAEKIRSYGYSAINQALSDTAFEYFSNPYELVQYLLGATRTYDFSQADINNLLIRMILEQGLKDRGIRSVDEISGKLWQSKKFVTTFILVNIILIILILLFTFRRRSNKRKNDKLK